MTERVTGSSPGRVPPARGGLDGDSPPDDTVLEPVRTGDHRLVRDVNRALLMELVRDRPRSRAELATVTGLNKATISKLVEALESDGLIRDAADAGHGARRGPGRPATLVEIDPGAGHIIGAELGVDFITVVLTDFRGQRLADAHAPVVAERGPAVAIRALEQLVADVIRGAGLTPAAVLGMGLSVCGLVDQQAGTIVFSPNHGWWHVPIRTELARRHGFPVFIENDARISALSEELFGVAKGVEDFVLVNGSAGIGVGIVSAGRLVDGTSGWAGEFGHMTIALDGPTCRCGNRGCWEALASEHALLARVPFLDGAAETGEEAGDDGRAGKEAGSEVDARAANVPESWRRVAAVAAIAAAGDRTAATAIRETGRYLGIGIANVINALNPSLVVIGGGLTQAADLLLPEVRAVVAERAMPELRRVCRIEAAALGIDTCAMGGVALAINELYTPSHLRIARPA